MGSEQHVFFSILCQPSSQYSLQYVLRLISSIVELVGIFFSIVRPSNLFLINWLGRLIAYTCYFQFSHSPSIMFWPSCSYRPHSFLTFFLLPDSHLSVWRTPSKPPQNIYSYISSVTFSVVRCYFHWCTSNFFWCRYLSIPVTPPTHPYQHSHLCRMHTSLIRPFGCPSLESTQYYMSYNRFVNFPVSF